MTAKVMCFKIVGIYKNIFLHFSLLKAGFICFCFALYKITDSEYITNINKSLNISIGTAMRNPEMLKFVPDHLKTMCNKHAIKNYLNY